MSLKNYEDSKCVYGYITLCDTCCAQIVQDSRIARLYKHVNPYKLVEGFPITDNCERCGRLNPKLAKQHGLII